MKKAKLVAFDMDGTLYQFIGASAFLQSGFGQAVQQNVRRLIATELGFAQDSVNEKYQELYERFDGEMSLALEREEGIDRMKFFDMTWNLDPAEFN